MSAQLTSAEWLASWPGTDAEKRLVADCMSCHTLERIARSVHPAEEWVQIIPRMLRYAQNTMPLAPQMRTGESTGLLVQQPERLQRLAEYLASVNQSASDTFPYDAQDAQARERPRHPRRHHDLQAAAGRPTSPTT